MPDPDGYEYWPLDDPNPFPVSEPNATADGEYLGAADCTLKFPPAIPFGKSIAERSIGIRRSWKFTFALRSTRGAGGQITSNVLCTAKHVTWFPDHPETGPGGVQTFEIGQAAIGANRQSITKDIAHGPHFDRVTLSHMLLANGEVFLQFLGNHQIWGHIGVPDEPEVTPSPSGGTPDPHTPPPPTPPAPPTPPPPDKPPVQPKPPKPDEPTAARYKPRRRQNGGK